MRALDFTSALYLGLTHDSRSLDPWTQLTTGKPAALSSPPGAERVAADLAQLIGCERAVLAPSTLHLFWDLFGLLSKEPIAIYMDAGLYAVGRWGVERAAARGVPVRSFRHHDPQALDAVLACGRTGTRRPLIVTDGFCPACGTPAPLRAYLECARRYRGQLVIDDTQALGVLGHMPSAHMPYGFGGGGSLRWHRIRGADVMVVSSLAKGFGVPVAVLAGSRECVDGFQVRSDTLVHSSPPSTAVCSAATNALTINRSSGDVLRARLAGRVAKFRKCLAAVGVRPAGAQFPVQTFRFESRRGAEQFHDALLSQNIRSVLVGPRAEHRGGVALIVTARHTADQIEYAAQKIASVLSCDVRGLDERERRAQ